MQAIKLMVTGAQALVTQAPTVTSGMVGLPVELNFDAQWDHLKKTLVFKAGTTSRLQMEVGEQTVVPWEVLAQPGHTLRIGVYGTNEDGLAIPTVWATVGLIQEGADPNAEPSMQPESPVWAQLEKKPKLLLELRIPGVNQGFDRHQRWDDAYKAFQAYDEDGAPIAWNLDWWKDSQLPANTTLPEILQSLFDSLQVYEPMYMDVRINGGFRAAGYPTFTRYTSELGEVDDRLMVVVSDILNPYTESDATSVIEVGRKMISCSASMGRLCQENGWSVRIYGREV